MKIQLVFVAAIADRWRKQRSAQASAYEDSPKSFATVSSCRSRA